MTDDEVGVYLEIHRALGPTCLRRTRFSVMQLGEAFGERSAEHGMKHRV